MAFKLATGAGKTTVMAMLIAWQTLNAVRRPASPNFARGFLIVAPGLTIKERLRVLQPNDPENYYQHREIVPSDLLLEIDRAKIVITNYHAFKLRERMEVSKGTRALLEGRGGSIKTLETEGQMLQRVMPELMSMKNILVINDEAHHCYRHKVVDEETGGKKQVKLDADEKEEMRKNREAARLWISGLEIVKRKLGISRVVDLSATPFFLAGSGYREGTLFPWTMSDFSLMDAIESGIVKLPRVPVSDNIPGEAVPRFRNLWEHIRRQMPRKGKSKAGVLDPLSIPQDLKTALDALYGHYEKTFAKWQEAGSEVPPCFIVVCNNTSSSKLVYDYISGFYRKQEDGTERLTPGRLALFRNFDEYDSKLARPRTLLIDSEQLESGEALDDNFRSAAADEIERFRREMVERSGNQIKAEDIDDVAILREAMNTVGRKGQLGESIRCVVSVSMLTEGWDANTVTHVLGVRAFGTQLLCEQVIGRALRRRSYTLNQENLFNVEYADILGIPFDFTAKPVDAPVQLPPDTIQVKAISPERDALEIRFPRVQGYRAELPPEELAGRVHSRLYSRTQSATSGSLDYAECRYHRRVSQSDGRASGRHSLLDHRDEPDQAFAFYQVARHGRGAEAASVSAAQAHYHGVGGDLPSLHWRYLPGAGPLPGPGRDGLRTDHPRHNAQVRWPGGDQGPGRPIQSCGFNHPRQLQHVEDAPLAD